MSGAARCYSCGQYGTCVHGRCSKNMTAWIALDDGCPLILQSQLWDDFQAGRVDPEDLDRLNPVYLRDARTGQL